MDMITRLEDFKTYNKAMSFGEKVWGVVAHWSYFEKDTIGKQLVKSADSIAANLSEGLGDTISKKSKTSATTHADLYSKQRHGLQKQVNEP